METLLFFGGLISLLFLGAGLFGFGIYTLGKAIINK